MLYGNNRKQANSNDSYDPEQIREIITSCGVSVGTELDTHFLVFCPFHNNRNTPACEVDKEKGLFLCFSCGENGTILDFVMRTTNRTYFESARIISNAAKAGDFVQKIDKSIIPKEEFSSFDSGTIERLHSSLMQDNKAISYFTGRGITKKASEFFKLGYSDKQDMVTVPVYSHTGVCVGFVARSVEGKAFKNSTGLPRSKVLFNLNNCKFQDIVVVESSFDAIRLWQLDRPAVATLGANVGTVQLALLNKYANTVIVAPDGDEAGNEMVSKLIRGLAGKDIRVMQIPEGKKDIGDMTDEEINHAYSQIKALDLALNI